VEDALSLRRLKFVEPNVKEAFGRAGIHSLWQLVEHGLTARERRLLAKKLGVKEGDVLKLARIADMCRLCDLELAELLVETGVNTPLELPFRPLSELCAMVSEAALRLSLEPPSCSKLRELRMRARSLPPLFDY